MLQHIRVWFPRIASVPLIIIALSWGWVFGFTDFRSHQRVPMLAIATVVLVYAVLLLRGKGWAVFSSIVLALLSATAALYFQSRIAFLNPALIATAVIALVYAIGLGWALRANGWKMRDYSGVR